jgi:hypothetical protein
MFGLTFRELLPNWAQQELDQLVAKIKGYLLIEHNEDGGHTDITGESLDVEGDVDAGGHGFFEEDVISLFGTGDECGIGALLTVNGTSLLPPGLLRQALLLGGVTSGVVLEKRPAASPFTAGNELTIWLLGFSSTVPALRLGDKSGAMTLLDGGTGAALNIGDSTVDVDSPNLYGKIVLSHGTFTAKAESLFTNLLIPPQITANQNNYNPTGLSTAFYVRLTVDAARDITGLATGATGRVIVLNNQSAFTITLKHNNAGSDANKRFFLPGAVDLALNQYGSATLYYDGGWVVLGKAT